MQLDAVSLYLTACQQQLDLLDVQVKLNVLLGDDDHDGPFLPGTHHPTLVLL